MDKSNTKLENSYETNVINLQRSYLSLPKLSELTSVRPIVVNTMINESDSKQKIEKLNETQMSVIKD